MLYLFLPVLTTSDDSVYASHEETLTDEARVVKIAAKLFYQTVILLKNIG